MKRFFSILFSFFLYMSICVGNTTVYTIDNIPNVHLSNAQDFVSNPDGILSPATVNELNRIILSIQEQTSSEIAVVVVQSIGDEEIKPFATNIFAKWGIGKKDKDNGLLILFVLEKREITFETGYGMEGVLPDAICKRIQTLYMLPYFKKADYNKGMIEGLRKIQDILSHPETAKELITQVTTTGKNDWSKPILYYVIVSILFSLFYILLIRNSSNATKNRNNYEKYRALVSYKSSTLVFAFIFPFFIAFVHIWLISKLRRLRNSKITCDHCGQKMRKLDENEDNKYLTPQENTEEKLNSIDYDVCLCDNCNNIKVFPYENMYTKYSKCPYCHAKTYSLVSDSTLVAPTPFSTGTGEKRYHCAHCLKDVRKQYIIPMIVVPPPSGHRGGDGFGGGGFGGGSFGGGRSGGGGATSGW